jgi:hypothetical protein
MGYNGESTKGLEMIQFVEDQLVYIVDFDTMPNLPIVGTGIEQYYAEALTDALKNGKITEPGKYAISIDWTFGSERKYTIFKVIEDAPKEEPT